MREPAFFRFHPDHVEAVIALGELDRAENLVGRLEARGQVFPRPWTLAIAARCRGLLLAARGDVAEAAAALDRALAEHERLPMPFELARTLLASGVVARRAKRKRVARDALEQALAEFERLPAPLWAERARAELGRVGARPNAPDELTASELRVAELAAAGLTNKEVAASAFLSEKTVDRHLENTFRKLGVPSRAAAAAFAVRERIA